MKQNGISSSHQREAAILFMMLSALSLSMMQLMVKLSAQSVGTFEQVFCRNLFSMAIAAVLLRKERLAFRVSSCRGPLFLRSLFGFLGILLLFLATAGANQADVSALNKTSPVWVSLFSWMILKERIPKVQFAVIILCLTGAFFSMQPTFDSSPAPLIMAFLSAVVNGVAYVMIAYCRNKVHPLQVIFWFSLFSTVVSGFCMIPSFVIPSAENALQLLLIAIFGAGGQLGLTYAYQKAPASEVSIYNYISIPFSAILGIIFLQEHYTVSSLVGSLLIIGGGALSYLSHKKGTEKQPHC